MTHTKHINKLCGQNVEFLHVSVCGAYNYHQALNSKCFDGNIYVFSLTNFKQLINKLCVINTTIKQFTNRNKYCMCIQNFLTKDLESDLQQQLIQAEFVQKNWIHIQRWQPQHTHTHVYSQHPTNYVPQHSSSCESFITHQPASARNFPLPLKVLYFQKSSAVPTSSF
jgi:hypothetical protein